VLTKRNASTVTVGFVAHRDGRLTVIHADAHNRMPPKSMYWNVVWHDIWDDICAAGMVTMRLAGQLVSVSNAACAQRYGGDL
jgi:hypothetical protein